MATTELQRDIAWENLTNGLKEAKKRSKSKNQKGNVKFNGRKSYLEVCNLNKTKKLKLKSLTKQFRADAFGCRELAKKYSATLNLDQTMGHETAKRLAFDIEKLQ